MGKSDLLQITPAKNEIYRWQISPKTARKMRIRGKNHNKYSKYNLPFERQEKPKKQTCQKAEICNFFRAERVGISGGVNHAVFLAVQGIFVKLCKLWHA